MEHSHIELKESFVLDVKASAWRNSAVCLVSDPKLKSPYFHPANPHLY